MRWPDPYEPVTVYRSPDWQARPSDEAPAYRLDWAALRQQCLVAVGRRESHYPQMVREGRIDADLAARDLDAWRALVAEWHWIITGEGEAPHNATLLARIDAVQLALERLEAELERGRTSADNLYQFHLLTALAWHLGDGRQTPRIHFTARFNHDRRAKIAALKRSAA